MRARLLALLGSLALAGGLGVWQTLGVEPGSAQMARLERITAGRNVFDDDALLLRRHAALKDTLGEVAARLILLRHPLLLTHDLEETIRPKLRTLHELLPGINISRTLVRAPSLLNLNPEATLAPRLETLKQLLGTRAAAIKAISRTPTLLNLRDIDARYARLQVNT